MERSPTELCLPSKALCCDKPQNGRLEQRELVRDKRVAVNEVILIPKVRVGQGTVRKVKQSLEIVVLHTIDVRQQPSAFCAFLQQALLNDLLHVGTGQFHAVGKSRLNLGKIVTQPFAHFAHNHLHVFLGGHDDPRATSALGGKTFGNSLKVCHELDVFGYVLTRLIDKKIQTERRLLLLNVGVNPFGKILNGDPVFVFGNRSSIPLADASSLPVTQA